MKAHLSSALAAAALLVAGAAGAETLALVGATVHTVGAGDLAPGVVVVENGKITAVGRDLTPPAGAKVVDLAGKHLYPGFVDVQSTLGLVEVGSVRGTVDTTEIGEDNANIHAEVAFNSDSILIPVAIAGGVLTAHIVPDGGIVNGTSAVMTLRGWNWRDMTLASGVGMHLTYPRTAQGERRFGPPQSEEDFKKEKDKALKALQDIFDGARAYQKARAAVLAKQGPAVELDPRLEALIPLFEGKMPLFIHADEQTQIASALDWAKKEKLARVVLVAGEDAQYLAARLAADKIPVVLNGVLAMPNRRSEAYDAAYAAAGVLHAAGVQVAIATGDGASMARNLPFHAGMAAAFGLPKDVALRSITLTPAEILGVADRVGSIAVGRDATLFSSDGDALEARTRIERAWIAGAEMDLTRNHQWELYQKYKNRPLPAK